MFKDSLDIYLEMEDKYILERYFTGKASDKNTNNYLAAKRALMKDFDNLMRSEFKKEKFVVSEDISAEINDFSTIMGVELKSHTIKLPARLGIDFIRKLSPTAEKDLKEAMKDDEETQETKTDTKTQKDAKKDPKKKDSSG